MLLVQSQPTLVEFRGCFGNKKIGREIHRESLWESMLVWSFLFCNICYQPYIYGRVSFVHIFVKMGWNHEVLKYLFGLGILHTRSERAELRGEDEVAWEPPTTFVNSGFITRYFEGLNLSFFMVLWSLWNLCIFWKGNLGQGSWKVPNHREYIFFVERLIVWLVAYRDERIRRHWGMAPIMASQPNPP